MDGLVGNNYPPLSFYGIGLLPFVADEFKLEELALTGKGKEADVASMLDARRISSFANTGLAGDDASLFHWWRGNP